MEEEVEEAPSEEIGSIVRESVTRSGVGSRGKLQAESTASAQSRRREETRFIREK